jgi:hypothetical protein
MILGAVWLFIYALKYPENIAAAIAKVAEALWRWWTKPRPKRNKIMKKQAWNAKVQAVQLIYMAGGTAMIGIGVLTAPSPTIKMLYIVMGLALVLVGLELSRHLKKK